ncbi:glycoside hydrolase family 26 protein [Streptomyces sp. NPDC001046]|uniref:glycoside hydrolase family 26 protein n=1 Tax=Streptomyces sp. NPDC001046 TaxID=3364543 RepID=UPI0036819575
MATRQRRARSRRLAFVAAAVAAAAVLASGQTIAAGAGTARSDEPAPPAVAATPAATAPPAGTGTPAPGATDPGTATPAPTASAPPARTAPAIGAYLDYGPRGVARMAQLSTWLGGAELRVGHTYLPGDRWSNIEGLPGFLDVWANWRREKADRLLVLNVPMMERNEENVSDREVRRLLREAAAGRFDHHFRTLGERLVELGVPDTVLVLGWEMNGITYTHRCGPDPQSWKQYWNRIVTTMRAVPGQKFRFDFTPSRGRDAVPWTECYPGDDTVDIIGLDAYDQPRGMSFEEQKSEPYGLQHHVDFAEAHGKAISFPEWGLFRNGDNPEYMQRMLAWMDEHKPLYQTLTDYCPHGVWQCGANPRASEVYRSFLFGRKNPDPAPTTSSTPTAPAQSPSPAPTPTPQPSRPAPARPADCSPLNLGEWVEYWIGGKLCLRLDWWSRTTR